VSTADGTKGTIQGWTPVTPTDPPHLWAALTNDAQCGTQCPPPMDGTFYFYANVCSESELFQDVDVSAYAASIARGKQRFSFEGYVRSFPQGSLDTSRFILEYRNASGSILATFDSTQIGISTAWQRVAHTQTAPVGTTVVRVRMVDKR